MMAVVPGGKASAGGSSSAATNLASSAVAPGRNLFAKWTVVAAALLAATGCTGSGGGLSIGTYTSPGSLIMTFSGHVQDQNGIALAGYGVSIDGVTPVKTDALGNYKENVPTVAVPATGSPIEVFDPSNRLAHEEVRQISTAVCIQALTPIVVGPPTPP
jgi:hypothetical protein